MEKFRVILNEENVMNIEDVNIFNNGELENIDADILSQSISDGYLDSIEEIKSFCDGCDRVNAYYSPQTAKDEFESYLNLSKAELVNEYEINLHNELL